MAETEALPEPPALAEQVFKALEAKAALPLGTMIVLAVLAGMYIGFGGLFATVALAGADGLPFGVPQALAGLVFSVGLALVLIAGAELFTGNMLMAGPLVAGRVRPAQVISAFAIVYCANFAGSLLLAGIVLMAGVHEAGGGSVARAALELGATKTGNGFMTTFASGILANMLVCLGVWLGYAGRTVTQKIAGLLLPIAAFVAAGLEHSVANMYLLPYAYMVQLATEPAGGPLSIPAMVGNIVPTTLGNMVGGALVALAYWYAFAERLKAKAPDGFAARQKAPA